MEKMALDIDGMSCSHCVARVKQALSATPGVLTEDVTVGGAAVTYDATVATPETIAASRARRWRSAP